MSESGIRALTLPVIFEHAHTGAGTFYHYFKDREDLLDAVYAHCFDLAIEELSDKDDPDATTRERFNCFCRNMFHAYRVYPREFNFLYWYTFGYVEPDVNCCRVIPSVMLLTRIIDRGQKEGIVASGASASVLARMVRGMAASMYWGYQRDAYDMSDENAQRFADAAWRAIGAQ